MTSVVERASGRLWVERAVAAPAPVLWELLVDVDRWPDWGPSVAAVFLDGDRFEVGATGSVRTPVGVRLPFVVTAVEPGRRWAWRVAGVPATDHVVVPRGEGCVVRFGVPFWASPYLAVCRVALDRLEALARHDAPAAAAGADATAGST